ncbi:hypothetical protein NL676_029964 [Syzygium grande]|nr:hypothetical protein NL676_029964 [Syzygium grande]
MIRKNSFNHFGLVLETKSLGHPSFTPPVDFSSRQHSTGFQMRVACFVSRMTLVDYRKDCRRIPSQVRLILVWGWWFVAAAGCIGGCGLVGAFILGVAAAGYGLVCGVGGLTEAEPPAVEVTHRARIGLNTSPDVEPAQGPVAVRAGTEQLGKLSSPAPPLLDQRRSRSKGRSKYRSRSLRRAHFRESSGHHPMELLMWMDRPLLSLELLLQAPQTLSIRLDRMSNAKGMKDGFTSIPGEAKLLLLSLPQFPFEDSSCFRMVLEESLASEKARSGSSCGCSVPPYPDLSTLASGASRMCPDPLLDLHGMKCP